MPSDATKPDSPRVYRREGAPLYWWTMEGPRRTFAGDAGDVADLSGQCRSGVRTGGTRWVDGWRGKALRFDGTGDLKIPAPRPSSYPTIRVTLLPDDASGLGIFDTAPFSGNVLRTRIGKVDWWNLNPSLDLNMVAGQIQEIGFRFRFDGFRRIDYFRNGRFVATATGNDDPSWEWNQLVIGSVNGGGDGYFSGLIDDVRVDARPVSDAEFARDYDEPYWRLNRPTFRVFPTLPDPSPFHPYLYRSTAVVGSGVV